MLAKDDMGKVVGLPTWALKKARAMGKDITCGVEDRNPCGTGPCETLCLGGKIAVALVEERREAAARFENIAFEAHCLVEPDMSVKECVKRLAIRCRKEAVALRSEK